MFTLKRYFSRYSLAVGVMALAFSTLRENAFCQSPSVITDLKLRRSTATPGQYSFRQAGDGILRSYDSTGNETAAWDSETGAFSGGITLPSNAVTNDGNNTLAGDNTFTGETILEGKIIQPTSLVYEVSPDGSREYTTIQDAVAAISLENDDETTKVIFLYPGTYTTNESIILDVDKTHIVGIAKEAVWVKGKVDIDQVDPEDHDGTFNIRANNCSFQNLVVENTALDSMSSTYKACAVHVFESLNFIATNCRFAGYTDDPGNNGMAWDVLWVRENSTARFDGCEIYGGSDVVSVWNADLVIENSIVQAATNSGVFLWQATNAGKSVTFRNVTSKGNMTHWAVIVSNNSTTNFINVGGFAGSTLTPSYLSSASSGAGNAINVVGTGGREVVKAGFTYNYPQATGTGLTGLNGSNIASGTVPNARLDSDLTALGNNATNGIWARTATGTGAARTITGTGTNITVTNGDGVSGNPTIDVGTNVAKLAATQTWTGANTFNAVTNLNGVKLATRNVINTNSTLTVNDYYIFAEGYTANVTLTLPTTAQAPIGTQFEIISINWAVGNTLTIESPTESGVNGALNGAYVIGAWGRSITVTPQTEGLKIYRVVRGNAGGGPAWIIFKMDKA